MGGREDENNFTDEYNLDSILEEFGGKPKQKAKPEKDLETLDVDIDSDVDAILKGLSDKFLKNSGNDSPETKPAYTVHVDLDGQDKSSPTSKADTEEIPRDQKSQETADPIERDSFADKEKSLQQSKAEEAPESEAKNNSHKRHDRPSESQSDADISTAGSFDFVRESPLSKRTEKQPATSAPTKAHGESPIGKDFSLPTFESDDGQTGFEPKADEAFKNSEQAVYFSSKKIEQIDNSPVIPSAGAADAPKAADALATPGKNVFQRLFSRINDTLAPIEDDISDNSTGNLENEKKQFSADHRNSDRMTIPTETRNPLVQEFLDAEKSDNKTPAQDRVISTQEIFTQPNGKAGSASSAPGTEEKSIGTVPTDDTREKAPETAAGKKRSIEMEEQSSEVSPSGMAQKVIQFKLPSLNDAPVGKKTTSRDSNKKNSHNKPVESADFAPVSVETAEIKDDSPEVSDYNKYAAEFLADDKATKMENTFHDNDSEERAGLLGRFRNMMAVNEDNENTIADSKPGYRWPVSTPHRAKTEDKPESDFPDEARYSEEGVYDREDTEPDSMTPVLASVHYAKGLGTLQIKGVASIIISLIMVCMSLSYETAFPFPIDFTDNGVSLAATLLLMQLLVMLIGLDVITSGVICLTRLQLGSESLLTIASIVCGIDAAHMIISGDITTGLPYCAVIAFAIGCYLIGLRLTKAALKTTLKTAASASSPYVVSGGKNVENDNTILMKMRRSPEGFLRKCQQVDFSEHAFNRMAPLLLVMAIVFALVAAIAKSVPGNFLHYFAALITVAVTFSGLISYGLPFSMLSKKLSKVGAALGGWGGACDIDDAVGGIITDHDVFPSGTLSISGIRIFRKTETSKAISYTASLINESGGGLAEIFTELVRRQKYTFYPVSEFACYEGGGIGATINSDEVIIGSSNFMNLMGIRLPNNLNVKNAVFTAIKGELVGVFSINYVPINSVQEALISIFRTKIQPLFAIRDFNVTPLMLQHKFKISTDKIEFLSFEERYRLSSQVPDAVSKPSAVLCREGLGPYADIMTGGKRLKRAVRNNVIFSIVGSIVGLLIMFYLCFIGAYMSASPSNMLLFMALWIVPVIIISRSATYN